MLYVVVLVFKLFTRFIHGYVPPIYFSYHNIFATLSRILQLNSIVLATSSPAAV